MKKSFSSTIAAVLTVVLVVATTRVAEAQNDCVSKLVQCADYLNSIEKPAPTCCNAISEVVGTQLNCLCSLYNNPGILGGINMTQALEIPKRCNLSANTNACNNAMSPGSSVPPPAVPGGGNDGNAAGRISWMGMPALLLVSAITLLY